MTAVALGKSTLHNTMTFIGSWRANSSVIFRLEIPYLAAQGASQPWRAPIFGG